MVTSDPNPPPKRQASAVGAGSFLLGAILLVAFNLRPAATSVGPVLEEISDALSYTPVVAGVLTATPVLMFGLFALLTPTFVRWFGLHLLALLSITVTGVGLTARPFTDNGWVFLLLSAVGVSGLAVLNVILPSLVKQHFPDRIGMATALYTGSMSVGLSAGALLTYPIASVVSGEGWRVGLGVWGLTALVCVPVWLVVASRHRGSRMRLAASATVSWAQTAGTRLGWLLALFFGIQSFQAYSLFGWFAQMNRDAGFSAQNAGLLLSVMSIASIPAGFVAANLMARENLRVRLVVFLAFLCAIGYVGVLVMGVSVWIWVAAVVIGTGQGVFPAILTLIGMKSNTVGGTAGLSAFTQSVGYAFAALGPFGMGLLHELSGGWTVPLLTLMVLSGLQAVVGWLAIRQPQLEEQLS